MGTWYDGRAKEGLIMLDITKEKIKELETKIEELKGRISIWQAEIDTHQESINRLEAAKKRDRDAIAELVTEIIDIDPGWEGKV